MHVSGHSRLTAFAKAAGQSVQNMSSYLSGTKTPGSRVLASVLKHLYGGRHPNVEFFNVLFQISGYPTKASFAKACGLSSPNATSYLNGTKIPKARALARALQDLYGWPVKRLAEIQPLPANLNQLPKEPGVYVLYDSGMNVLYVGKAKHFDSEIRQTLGRRVPTNLRLGPTLKNQKPRLGRLATLHSLYKSRIRGAAQN